MNKKIKNSAIAFAIVAAFGAGLLLSNRKQEIRNSQNLETKVSDETGHDNGQTDTQKKAVDENGWLYSDKETLDTKYVKEWFGKFASAICMFYAEKERYPSNLEELEPRYITEFPDGKWKYDSGNGDIAYAGGIEHYLYPKKESDPVMKKRQYSPTIEDEADYWLNEIKKNGNTDLPSKEDLINSVREGRENAEKNDEIRFLKEKLNQDYPQTKRMILFPSGPVIRLEVVDEESEMPIADAVFELKKENGEDIAYNLNRIQDLPYSTVTNRSGIAAMVINRCDVRGIDKISKYVLRTKGYYSKRGSFPLEEILNHLSTHTEKISDDIIKSMNIEYYQEQARSFDAPNSLSKFWPAVYDLSNDMQFKQPAPYTLLPLRTKMKRIPQNIKINEGP